MWRSGETEIGGIRILRPLPGLVQKSIGPFVLFDHFGPVPAFQDKLAPHPHAGIEVMTYLISGSNEHRDSAGNVGRVTSGGAQWMCAGSGILHSEATLPTAKPFHGLQVWSRLRKEAEDLDPTYMAVQSEEVPVREDLGARVRVLAGTFGELEGPIHTSLQSLMCHVILEQRSEIELDSFGGQWELGAYVIDGNARFESSQSIRTKKGDIVYRGENSGTFSIRNTGTDTCHVFLLAGAPLPEPIVFGGPFVYDSQEGVRRAQHRFATGGMGRLDGVPF